MLQVAEHALQDRPRPDRHQELRAEAGVGVVLREQRRARGEVEAGAVVERVEPLARTAAHEEVPGHPDAVQLEPAAPTDLEHDHAERDRDAEMAVEHVVEERVARVAVVGRRCRGSPRTRTAASTARRPRSPRHARRERVELREAGVDVEVGVGVRGDEQRGLVERDLGLRARHELGEALGDVQGSTVAPVR